MLCSSQEVAFTQGRTRQQWVSPVSDGTLDECIRQLMSKPASKRHLYEIHTAPQGELISAVLTTDQIVELVRLRDFLSAGTGGVFSFEQCGGRATCCRVSSGDSEAAEAIRDLVETVTVFRIPSHPGSQLRLSDARTRCLGSRPPPNLRGVWGKMVARGRYLQSPRQILPEFSITAA